MSEAVNSGASEADLVKRILALDNPQKPEAQSPQDLPSEDGEPAPNEEAASGYDDEGLGDPDYSETEDQPLKPAIEPPQSWGAEGKALFSSLPPAVQEQIAHREKQRDTFVSQKANEAAMQMQQAQQVLRQYAQGVEQISQMMRAKDPFANINWAELSRNDPAEYVAQMEARRQYQDEMSAVERENQRMQQELQAQQMQQHQAALQQEFRKLVESDPIFSDPVKAKAEAGRISAFLERNGFSKDEIAGIADSRVIRLVQSAMRYQDAQSSKQAGQARPGQRAAMAPGAQTGPRDHRQEYLSKLQGKAKKTQSDRDFAALLMARQGRK